MKICKKKDCSIKHYAHGYCSKHARYFVRYGTLESKYDLHGMYKTIEYTAWKNMKKRCYAKNYKAYKNYGARGITVCERWVHSFSNFYADMGDKPTSKHSLDRIDNNGDYSPENCKWATRTEQSTNTRRNVNVTLNGITKTLTEWARLSPLKFGTIMRRYYKWGWSAERAITQPRRGELR